MRNLANCKPPEFIKVGENVYPINFNFLIWIDILELFDDLDIETLENMEDIEVIEKIERLAFGTLLYENVFDVLKAVTGFAGGYPQVTNKNANPATTSRLFDFKLDLNSILIAIRDQSGIDLTCGDSIFHWWLFLIEFNNLIGEHHICKLMELRAYNGEDKDMKRARDSVMLPPRKSKKQKQFNDEMNEIFYNC